VWSQTATCTAGGVGWEIWLDDIKQIIKYTTVPRFPLKIVVVGGSEKLISDSRDIVVDKFEHIMCRAKPTNDCSLYVEYYKQYTIDELILSNHTLEETVQFTMDPNSTMPPNKIAFGVKGFDFFADNSSSTNQRPCFTSGRGWYITIGSDQSEPVCLRILPQNISDFYEMRDVLGNAISDWDVSTVDHRVWQEIDTLIDRIDKEISHQNNNFKAAPTDQTIPKLLRVQFFIVKALILQVWVQVFVVPIIFIVCNGIFLILYIRYFTNMKI
jgi:hypothetical protein